MQNCRSKFPCSDRIQDNFKADSKVILDWTGAECLFGNGDMLSFSELVRIQYTLIEKNRYSDS